jgi:hypothetical protein
MSRKAARILDLSSGLIKPSNELLPVQETEIPILPMVYLSTREIWFASAHMQDEWRHVGGCSPPSYLITSSQKRPGIPLRGIAWLPCLSPRDSRGALWRYS